jgi:hypothetical protein
MNKHSSDIERFLPYGEMLRDFLGQPFIAKSDIVDLLRERGIFVSSSEKKDTIPLVTNLIVNPREFDFLRESQNTKEDSQKVNTQTISWDSTSALLENIPDNFDINSVLDLEFSNFTVVGSPNFIPVNQNQDHLLLEFEIERNDFSKNWCTVQSTFKGSLELKKEEDKVEIILTHTAKETKYVADKISRGMINHFKTKGCVDNHREVTRIEFCQFSNSDRILYFLSLTQNIKSNLLQFEDIVDVEFSPESELERELPEKIKWMENKINDLKLNGKGLQHTLFIEDKELHEFVQLHHVLSRYRFNYEKLKGHCEISGGFPEYSRNKEMKSEFEINIKNISFDSAQKTISRSEMEKIIFREFNKIKLKNFNKITNQSV